MIASCEDPGFWVFIGQTVAFLLIVGGAFCALIIGMLRACERWVR